MHKVGEEIFIYFELRVGPDHYFFSLRIRIHYISVVSALIFVLSARIDIVIVLGPPTDIGELLLQLLSNGKLVLLEFDFRQRFGPPKLVELCWLIRFCIGLVQSIWRSVILRIYFEFGPVEGVEIFVLLHRLGYNMRSVAFSIAMFFQIEFITLVLEPASS